MEISEHHHLVAIILKSEFIKGNPKTKSYRDYKKFDTEKFRAELYSRPVELKKILGRGGGEGRLGVYKKMLVNFVNWLVRSFN